MNISGHTKSFAVLGHPVGHTLSPAMHNAAIAALGMDAVYLAFDVPPDRLMSVLRAMAVMGFGGVNLTIPLKEVASKELDDLDASARLLGSVNTVEFLSGGMRGHSTDGRGFLAAINESFGTGIAGLSVFILGSGGAGRAVALTCAKEGAGRVIVSDIISERANQVAAEISKQCSKFSAQAVGSGKSQWEEACRDADLVVQATPVGMKKDDQPLLGPEAFRDGQMVYDLVYMYPETAFMKAARKSGARTSNGLGMLLHQGALSFSIWTGKKPPVDVMRKALEQKVYGKEIS